MQQWNFWGGVVAKPWYFTVLAGSTDALKKSIALEDAPLVFPTAKYKGWNAAFEGEPSCKTMPILQF